MTSEKDFYETLQVHHDAQQEVIEAAYRRLLRMYHPDVNTTPEAHEMTVNLNKAYETLSDPIRRAEYDRSRDNSAQDAGQSDTDDTEDEDAGPAIEREYGRFAESAKSSQSESKGNYTEVRVTRALFSAAVAEDYEHLDKALSAGAEVNARNSEGRTPLHVAAFRGTTDMATALLNAGAEVNAESDEYRTPLHDAAQEGRIAALKVLLSSGARVDATDSKGFTALHLTSEKGYGCIARHLIENGASLDQKDRVFGWTPLIIAARYGHSDLAKLLIESGADVAARKNDGGTALHQAANHGHMEIVKSLLAAGAHLDSPDNDGWTPLFLAAAQGKSEVVHLLISQGADVNLTDSDNLTPLHAASSRSQQKVIMLLTVKGANVNAATRSSGWAPLHMASGAGTLEVLAKPVIYHARISGLVPAEEYFSVMTSEGDREATIEELVSAGADVGQGDIDGNTPLHIAATEGITSVIIPLVDAGADPVARNNAGWTPMHRAAIADPEDEATRELLAALAPSDIDARDEAGRTPLILAASKGLTVTVRELILEGSAYVNARDILGWTPLQWAVFNRDANLVKLLLSNGADPNTRNNEGWTPIHQAAHNGDSEIVNALIESGVDVNARDDDGTTALYWAYFGGHTATATALVSDGANEFTTDNDGWSTYDMLRDRSNAEAVKAIGSAEGPPAG